MRKLASLSKEQRVECLLALCEIGENFGKPHLHSGLSIRKPGPKTFECRGNLDLPIIFHDRTNELYLSFLGNHNEVRALLKSGKLY
jgi:hypothetical protein